MPSTVEDYIFLKLYEAGISRVFGYRRESQFIGPIYRNRLRYEMLDHVRDVPRSSDRVAYVASSDNNDLSACCIYGARYTGDGPAVFVVEHSAAQGTSMPQISPEYHFAAIAIIDDPATAAWHVYRVLNILVRERRPVYIGIIKHVASMPLSSAPKSSAQEDADRTAYSAVAMSFV